MHLAAGKVCSKVYLRALCSLPSVLQKPLPTCTTHCNALNADTSGAIVGSRPTCLRLYRQWAGALHRLGTSPALTAARHKELRWPPMQKAPVATPGYPRQRTTSQYDIITTRSTIGSPFPRPATGVPCLTIHAVTPGSHHIQGSAHSSHVHRHPTCSAWGLCIRLCVPMCVIEGNRRWGAALESAFCTVPLNPIFFSLPIFTPREPLACASGRFLGSHTPPHSPPAVIGAHIAAMGWKHVQNVYGHCGTYPQTATDPRQRRR